MQLSLFKGTLVQQLSSPTIRSPCLPLHSIFRNHHSSNHERQIKVMDSERDEEEETRKEASGAKSDEELRKDVMQRLTNNNAFDS
jgi:hypothetical protein